MTNKQKIFVKISALRQIACHLGMIAPSVKIPSKKEQAELIDKNYNEICLCLMVLFDKSASIFSKAACRVMLEIYIPGWRKWLGLSIEQLGHVVTRWDSEVYKWRNDVLNASEKICVYCGGTENLEAHHILAWAHFPESRLIIENGIALCVGCHKREHSIHGK